MKKLLIAIVALAIPAIGMAQSPLTSSSNSENVTVSASIGSSITFEKVNDLAFGDFTTVDGAIIPTVPADPSIDPTDVDINAAQRGLLEISGVVSNANIVINVTGDQLTDGVLTLYDDAGVSLKVTMQYFLDGFSTGNGTYVPGTTVVVDGTSASIYVGGVLEAVGTVPANIYNEDITIGVAYI